MPLRSSTITLIVACMFVMLASAAYAKTATGTDGDDRIVGTERADNLSGGAGRDTIEGLDGRDEIYGGTGGDKGLSGSRGEDEIYGRGGDDYLEGGRDADLLRGGNADDTIVASFDRGGVDRIFCGDGRDEVFADEDDVVDKASCERVMIGAIP